MKRSLNGGKHTSSSPIIRKRLSSIFELPGVNRVILGNATGCSHSMKFGHLKFKLDEPGKLIYSAFHAAGTVKVIVVIEKNADKEKIKKSIEAGNP